MEETNTDSEETSMIQESPKDIKKTNPMVFVITLVALGLIILPIALKLNKKEETSTVVPKKSIEPVLPASIRDKTNSNVETKTTPLSNDPNLKPTTGVVREITINGSNFKFNPSKITVNKGDLLRIVFTSTQGMHDLVIDGYNLSTKKLNADSSEEVNFIADKAGTFEYYCSVGNHRIQGMQGTLIVK